MAQKTMLIGFGGTTLSAASDATINAAGLYNSTIQTRYINIPKLMAKLNRKNFRHFDNKGYLLNYAVSIQQTGPGYRSLYSTANDNWVLKNAGRKWHAARMADFAKMGVTAKDLGEYNRTIRPYLDFGHASGTEVVLLDHDGDTIDGGEWTYTGVAAPAGMIDENSSDDHHNADFYSLVLTGVHGGVTTAGSRDRYSHVSMTQSYIQSRRTRDENIGSTAEPGEHTVQDPSPLLEFMQDSVAGGLKTAVLEDMQDEGAPYPGALGPQCNVLCLQGETETTAEYRRDGVIINAPGGLLQVRAQQNASYTGGALGPRYLVEVIGITRAEG